jgi:putative methionine-R-sulfoxide reductase with GAF domain
MSVPAFIGLFYTVKPIKEAVINFLVNHNFYNQIKEFEIPIVIIFCIIIPLIVAVYCYYIQRPYIDKDYDELQRIINFLDDILELKANRYYTYPQHGTDFLAMYVRPDIQIIKIKASLTAYFREVYDDLSILVDFFSVKEGKFKYEYNDESTPTSIDVVNKPNSTASTALKKKDIVTVADSTQKRVKFIPDAARDIKSIICYPIIEKSSVVYMICVSSKKKDVFNRENEDRNKSTLDIFAKRIKLEEYLKTIKEVQCD